jgi:hypothetical protein
VARVHLAYLLSDDPTLKVEEKLLETLDELRFDSAPDVRDRQQQV